MADDYEPRMATNRVTALTDGVYAIAMTILVLGFRVPAVNDANSLAEALVHMQMQFYDFVLSFWLLAIFWVTHHRHFHFIKRSDSKLLWINILSLLFVVLIPFSTSLFGQYRNMILAAVFFEINILMLGLVKYAQWLYVTKNHRLVDPAMKQSTIEIGKRLGLVTPAVSLVAIAVAFIVPAWSTTLFISIPFIIAVIRKN